MIGLGSDKNCWCRYFLDVLASAISWIHVGRSVIELCFWDFVKKLQTFDLRALGGSFCWKFGWGAVYTFLWPGTFLIKKNNDINNFWIGNRNELFGQSVSDKRVVNDRIWMIWMISKSPTWQQERMVYFYWTRVWSLATLVQTWDLSKVLHDQIFEPEILHTIFIHNETVQMH